MGCVRGLRPVACSVCVWFACIFCDLILIKWDSSRIPTVAFPSAVHITQKILTLAFICSLNVTWQSANGSMFWGSERSLVLMPGFAMPGHDYLSTVPSRCRQWTLNRYAPGYAWLVSCAWVTLALWTCVLLLIESSLYQKESLIIQIKTSFYLSQWGMLNWHIMRHDCPADNRRSKYDCSSSSSLVSGFVLCWFSGTSHMSESVAPWYQSRPFTFPHAWAVSVQLSWLSWPGGFLKKTNKVKMVLIDLQLIHQHCGTGGFSNVLIIGQS